MVGLFIAESSCHRLDAGTIDEFVIRFEFMVPPWIHCKQVNTVATSDGIIKKDKFLMYMVALECLQSILLHEVRVGELELGIIETNTIGRKQLSDMDANLNFTSAHSRHETPQEDQALSN